MEIEYFIEGCRLNNPKAQEGLYLALASKMMAVCLRYTNSQFDAEEILQTGFIKVFKNINQFAGVGSFEGWIRRIMVNTAIESCRNRTLFQSIDDINEVVFSNTHSFEIDQLEVNDLLKIIQSLAIGYRLVFNMYAIEGYSHKEIAKALNISEGSSKSQLSRARMRLQEKIKKMEGGLNEIRL